MVDTFIELFMNHLISESSQRRGKMSVVIETETEVTFIEVEIARVDSKLLNSDGFVNQQLFESIVKNRRFKESFELFF